MNNLLLAGDSFASGSLAAGWSAWPNLSEPAVLVGTPNVIQPTGVSTTDGIIWTGRSWSRDQVVEVTINNLSITGGAAVTLGARVQVVGGQPQGYQVVLNPSALPSSNQVIVFKFSGGIAAPIASSSATFTNGDVWTFAAIGSVLFVYQNGARIIDVGDASFFGQAAGSPGVFVESNSSSATSAQVSSIRLYSVQQQDGVWTKQGCILETSPTEIAANPSGNAGMSVNFGPSVFLKPGSSVYRGYWVYGGPELSYGESLDGINWSRYPSNPILATGGGCVNWINGVAHMYGQTTPGVSAPHHYTSPDGVTWTDRGATTGLQVAGFSCYSICPLTVINGVFYGLFGGLTTASNDAPVGFLATSTDGLAWTLQNGGSPVMNAFPGCNMFQVGNTYYMPATANQPGQGNPTASAFDPVEGVLYQSTDLIHWTVQSHLIHNALISDSLNNTEGGCAPLCILDVNGTAFHYYQGSPGDSTAPQNYQCMLATAPKGVGIANLVKFSQTGTQQLASDGFTNGSGPLSSSWTTQGGASAPVIAAGPVVQPSTTGDVDNAALFTAQNFSVNQYSEIVIKTLSGTAGQQFLSPIVLGQLGAVSGYYLRLTTPTGSISSGTNYAILRKTNGVPTLLSIASPTQITLSVGDVIRLQSSMGSDGSIILTVFQNGFQVGMAQDYTAMYTSGFPGIYLAASATASLAQISSWAGGNANVIPPYPIAYSVPDCRDYGNFPNLSINVNGTLTYTVPSVDSRKAGPPVDSRKAGPPTACGTYPQNSRTPGTFGPGE